MEDETQPPPAAASAISKVLDDDDLLVEILLRTGFPTTLVRAALVCTRWLGHVSDRAFLRRFRELNPPPLLGFYIEDWALPTDPPPFVQMRPRPRELGAVIRHARFSLEDYYLLPQNLHIHECRNGSVFIDWYDCERNILARVHSPLCPRRGLTILPSLPPCGLEGNRYCAIRQVLSQEDGGGLSYFCLLVESTLATQESEFCVKVYRLQDGCWHETLHILDCGKHHHPLCEPKAVLIDNKIYMPAGLSEIIVLDLRASSLSTIQVPPGVDHGRRGTTMLSWAEDASDVYLIQAKEFQLRIWIHKGDKWMLADIICLREMCDNLKKSSCTIEDDHILLLMRQVVHYGDFMFLKMGGCALHLDIKSRTLRKVYETEDNCLGSIYPFMMIWHPTFPALKHGPARNSI